MNSRGQAMVESTLVLLLLTFLVGVLLRSAYVAWADFVIDRENHRMVLCALKQENTFTCETVAKTKIVQLVRWGHLVKLNVRLTRDIQSYYESYGDIRYDIGWGVLHSKRFLSEKQILKASRR